MELKDFAAHAQYARITTDIRWRRQRGLEPEICFISRFKDRMNSRGPGSEVLLIRGPDVTRGPLAGDAS